MKTYTLKVSGCDIGTVQVSEDQLREIYKENPDLLEEKKSYRPWRAEKGKWYYTVTPELKVCSHIDSRNIADQGLYISGNYFKEKEEAQLYASYLEAVGIVTHAILEVNEGWKPDWSDHSEEKYMIIYKFNDDKCGIDYSCSYYRPLVIPYIKSIQLAKQIIHDYADELQTIFNY